MIAPFFLWGTAMVTMKSVIPQSTPLFVASLRLIPAGILVVAAAVLLNRPQPNTWTAWLWITLFALVDGSLFQGLLATGLTHTGAGLGSVMIDSQPLAVALLALWLFGERVGFWGWLGLMLGCLGISLVGLPDSWFLNFFQASWFRQGFPLSLNSGLNLLDQFFASGEGLMLLAALSMAVGTVMIRIVCRHADPVAATGWHMILGGLPLFAGSRLWESQQWVHLGLAEWLSLGYVTIFGSAIAYALFFYFASTGSLTSFSSLTFLTPLFAILFGNVFLTEVLSPIQWIGVCLTLISIYLVNQRDKLGTTLVLETKAEAFSKTKVLHEPKGKI